MENKRILITGSTGQVGWELTRSLANMGKIVAVDLVECDFTKVPSIQDLVRQIKPHIIVNPAAYTAVDRAEDEPELARAINSIAPGVLAEEAKKLDATIIHYSTDYVFGGDKEEPYIEEDIPVPVTVYGRSKLDGELAVAGSGARHLILRLAWVYATRASNFMLTMLRLGGERPSLNIVNDQYGAPTWSRMIAEYTSVIVSRILSGSDFEESIFHMPAAGTTTWFEYAEEIFKLANGRLLNSIPEVTPVSTDQYLTKARRPRYSVMSGEKLDKCYGIRLPDWKDQLKLAIDDLHESRNGK